MVRTVACQNLCDSGLPLEHTSNCCCDTWSQNTNTSLMTKTPHRRNNPTLVKRTVYRSACRQNGDVANNAPNPSVLVRGALTAQEQSVKSPLPHPYARATGIPNTRSTPLVPRSFAIDPAANNDQTQPRNHHHHHHLGCDDKHH